MNDGIQRVLAVFQYLGVPGCGILRVLAVFRDSVLLILPYLRHFGFNTLLCQVFQGSVLRVLSSTASVSSVDTASTRSTKILSICQVYSEYTITRDQSK